MHNAGGVKPDPRPEERSRVLAEQLSTALRDGSVLTDPAEMGGYLHDEAEWAPHEAPLAVARPRR